MFNKLKHRLIGTEEKKQLLSNISALGVLQGANYILPLLTVPYLVRILEPEYFGLLAFASATMGYFMLISDYGFNLSATRQISIHRDDLEKVNQIFNAVIIAKVGLMLVSFLLVSLMVFSFTKFSQHWEVYFITFGMVVGQVLFPVWLFQGMERMKYIARINICVRVLFTVGIFIFVKQQADYLLVPLLSSLGAIVTGIYSLYWAKRAFNISFSWQTTDIMKQQFCEAWLLFVSSISVNLYTLSVTFILGIFANNTVVGYFAVANKITGAAGGLYGIVGQATYPLVSRKIHQNKQTGLIFVKKLSLIPISGMLLISMLLLLFAEPIIYLLLGEQYQEAVLLLQIMAFLPFITAMSNVFGTQIMLNFGYKQALSRILMLAAALSVGLSVIFVPMYEALASASMVVVTEIFVTTTMLVFLWVKFRK